MSIRLLARCFTDGLLLNPLHNCVMEVLCPFEGKLKFEEVSSVTCPSLYCGSIRLKVVYQFSSVQSIQWISGWTTVLSCLMRRWAYSDWCSALWPGCWLSSVRGELAWLCMHVWEERKCVPTPFHSRKHQMCILGLYLLQSVIAGREINHFLRINWPRGLIVNKPPFSLAPFPVTLHFIKSWELCFIWQTKRRT